VSGSAPVPPLRGVIPILVTPFADDESIDFDALAQEVDFLAARGVSWVGLGFGSEIQRLDPGEAADVVAYVAAHPAGLRVVANADLGSSRAAAAAVRRLASAGAGAAMIRLSDMAGVTEPELLTAYRRVAEDGGLPLVVQDAGAMTGVDLSPQLLASALRDIPGVAAVKIEPAAPAPKMTRVVELLDGAPGTILGGAGGRDFAHELERGAHGTMPGPAFPERFAEVQRRHEAGDPAGARAALATLLPFCVIGDRGMDTFVFSQKHLLVRRGVLNGARLRGPHRPVETSRVAAELDDLLAEPSCAGLLGDQPLSSRPR
jgi:dihydrodipicolinate synthase/N-acetylneuraminate lyase